VGLVRKSGGGSQIPAGEKLRFRIESAEADEGDHGPQAKLRLKVLAGQHEGEELFEWCKIGQDEKTGEEYVADGGKLYNVAVAAFKDPKVLDKLDSVDDLLDLLVDKSFVSITKPRGSSGKYVGITWDMVYVDTEADAESEDEEDFSDIPF